MKYLHFSRESYSTQNAIEELPVETKPEVETGTVPTTESDVQEDAFVYVHCYIRPPKEDILVRVWKSTFLVDQNNGSKSALVHTENISLAPQWTLVPGNSNYSFLLIFTALAKSCTHFDLVEDIPQPGGFLIKNIPRNETDVYHVDLL